jgi:hypothetical protein
MGDQHDALRRLPAAAQQADPSPMDRLTSQRTGHSQLPAQLCFLGVQLIGGIEVPGLGIQQGSVVKACRSPV